MGGFFDSVVTMIYREVSIGMICLSLAHTVSKGVWTYMGKIDICRDPWEDQDYFLVFNGIYLCPYN